jgi:hypothetical protein
MNQLSKRAEFVARTLVLSVALFALLGLGAKSASAQVQTALAITNYTASTLTLVRTSFWENQEWIATCDEGDPNVLGQCSLSSPNWTLGPPATILPGQNFSFASRASGLLAATNGTGAQFLYKITPPPEATPVGATPPNYYAVFQWSTPWDSLPPVNDSDYTAFAAVQNCPEVPNSPGSGSGFGSSTQCGPLTETVDEFTAEVNFNGYGAGWFLVDSPPKATSTALMSGYAGSAIAITGANFDTAGLTEVLFGGAQSPKVTCASSTQCTAVVPQITLIPESVPVVVSVLGETTNVGNFTFLPGGPGCTYTAHPGISSGSVTAHCTPDALSDPILLYKSTLSGWAFVSVYTGTSAADMTLDTGVPKGTNEAYVACFSENGQLQGMPGTTTTTSGTPNGCDHPASITMGGLRPRGG